MSNKDRNWEEFIGQVIKPLVGTADAAAMSRGEPGFPGRFVWGGTEYTLAEVLESWKESGPCKSGSPEMYLRKHWFRIRTTDGLIMKIYFERQARSQRQNQARWWLYTITRPD